ncbi:unnamed protein product [Ixodes pacificus]
MRYQQCLKCTRMDPNYSCDLKTEQHSYVWVTNHIDAFELCNQGCRKWEMGESRKINFYSLPQICLLEMSRRPRTISAAAVFCRHKIKLIAGPRVLQVTNTVFRVK